MGRGHARAVLAVCGAARGRRRGRRRRSSRPTPASARWSTRDTATYRATQQVREVFGEEPVVVLAKGDLQELILTPNLFRLLRLEGCLSGKVPKGAKPIPGPCAELAELDPVAVPRRAGHLPQRGGGPDRRPAASGWPQHVPPDQLREFLLAGRRPATGSPARRASATQNSSPPSSSTCAAPRGTPKARLAYLFPNSHSAQIVLRLQARPERSRTPPGARPDRRAVDDTTPRKACADKGKPEPCFELHGGSYIVSGAPVVVDGLARALKDALLVLFAVALVVMALVPAARLPLAPAPAAAGDRAGRRGAHLRPPRPLRRLADDGLDRRRCRS